MFIIKNTTEYQENTGLFVVQKTEICLWRPLLSYSDVPHSGHLRLLLFSHFTLQSPEPHLSQRREGLSRSSVSICTYSSSFSLILFFFPLSSVLYRKVFQESTPPDKSGYYYIFCLALFLFQCRLRCLKLQSSLYMLSFSELFFIAS